jgi:hypothetical protein
MGSEKALNILANCLRKTWSLAQDVFNADLEANRKETHGMLFTLEEELSFSLWANCHAVARELPHSRKCSRLQFKAALELLHLCPILRATRPRLEALRAFEEKAENEDEAFMDFKRDLMEILLQVRIALQMAGRRVQLQDLDLSGGV